MAAKDFQAGIVPTVFRRKFQVALFAAQQPERRDNLSVSIGSIACHIADIVADIVTGNPAVTFRSDALSHAVHQNGVVGAGGAVAVNAVYVGKAGMVSATVKERLAVPESIESILVG